MLEAIRVVNAFLDMRPVQYLLLVMVVTLLFVSSFSLVRQKALSVQLSLAESAAQKCSAAAELAAARTAELELRVKSSADEIAKINSDYSARIDKVKNSRLTSDTCAGMIAESVRLLQEARE